MNCISFYFLVSKVYYIDPPIETQFLCIYQVHPQISSLITQMILKCINPHSLNHLSIPFPDNHWSNRAAAATDNRQTRRRLQLASDEGMEGALRSRQSPALRAIQWRRVCCSSSCASSLRPSSLASGGGADRRRHQHLLRRAGVAAESLPLQKMVDL